MVHPKPDRVCACGDDVFIVGFDGQASVVDDGSVWSVLFVRCTRWDNGT